MKPERNLQLDDSNDPIADALREQASAERWSPSRELRARTLTSLHVSASQPTRFSHSLFPRWLSVLAAAAMLTFAVMLARVFIPTQILPVAPPAGHSGSSFEVPSIQPRLPRLFADTPNVRLALLTAPLEREAEALRADWVRISNRVRSAIVRDDH